MQLFNRSFRDARRNLSNSSQGHLPPCDSDSSDRTIYVSMRAGGRSQVPTTVFSSEFIKDCCTRHVTNCFRIGPRIHCGVISSCGKTCIEKWKKNPHKIYAYTVFRTVRSVWCCRVVFHWNVRGGRTTLACGHYVAFVFATASVTSNMRLFRHSIRLKFLSTARK